MKLFEKFKKNKKVSVLIIIVIFLGLFLRFNDYGQESYHSDCGTYLPVALLWFYPHDYYPGLSGTSEPALGHFFIGLGCLASGEDFSRVTEIKPNFYPGRQILVGKELVNAERHCHIPIYIFSLLFFIVVIIFALVLLDIYSATYFISFFAFFPRILHFSRWINLNIFAYFFAILGLLFLWKAYTSQKAGKKELVFFILSAISFASAFSSKLPAGAYIIFLMFILLEKYKEETLFILNISFKNIGISLLSKYQQALNLKSLIKTGLASILAFVSVLFVAFEFSFMNIVRVIHQYNAWFGEHNTFGLNPVFLFRAFLRFFYSINFFDMLIFFFSIYIFLRLLFKKGKSKLEKFIVYQTFFLIFLSLTFKVLANMPRAFIIFFFGLILLMSLTFSNKEYSIAHLLRVSKKSLFFIFMIIYISSSFYMALSDSPYFLFSNKVLCALTKNEDRCRVAYINERLEAEFMDNLLKEDETFIPAGFINYYLRREDHLIYYIFGQQFTAQFNREPTLEEYITYYHPMNRTVRYVSAYAYRERVYALNLGLDYEPNYILKINGIESKWIYDVQNLTKRK